MTAREATHNALAAVAAGDLDALSRALAAREIALQNASHPEQADALREGETLARRLAEFRCTLAAEQARLGQLRQGLAGYSGPSPSRCVDLRA